MISKKLQNKFKKLNQDDINLAFTDATYDGNFEIVQYLLTSKELPMNADICTNKNWGVRSACYSNQLSIVKYLLTSPELKKHANIYAKESKSFRYACDCNYIELIEYLIFDYKIKQHENITTYLLKKKHYDVLKMFELRDLKETLNLNLYNTENQNTSRFKL